MRVRCIICACLAVVAAVAIGQAQTIDKVTLPSVQDAFANFGSTILIEGRFFAGIVATGPQGPYPSASLAIPDAKLRFSYRPSKNLTVVTRLSFNSASGFNPATGAIRTPSNVGFDYLYADINNWEGLLPGHQVRIGRMKIDFGLETWGSNPVENNLISNSVASPSGYDEGLDFSGPIRKGRYPIIYSVSILNGSKDVTPAVGNPLTVIKLVAAPVGQLSVSASYLNTGDLGVNSTDFTIAGFQTPPPGATNWVRHAWKADARWNFGPTGIQPLIPTGPTAAVPFQLAATYGQFADDATDAPNRDGNYWYIEGLYNLSKRVYAAARYSAVSLDHGVRADIADSPVPVSEYQRTALALGYRAGPLTVLKIEYAFNTTSGGASKPGLNQFALGLATKF